MRRRLASSEREGQQQTNWVSVVVLRNTYNEDCLRESRGILFLQFIENCVVVCYFFHPLVETVH